MNIAAADLLRFAVFASAALVTGAVLAVIRLHVIAVRRAPSGAGLLPRHVLAVSAAHLFYVDGVGWGITMQIGQDPHVSPRVGIYLAANLLTLFALYIVGRSQRRRVQRGVPARLEPTPDPPQPDVPRHRRHGVPDPDDPS